MVYATSVLCWALGGTSSGAVPRCDGYRGALGRNARVTARRVRDSPAGHPGAATTSRTAHLRSATTSGGARAATLGCCVGRGHATYVITVGGTRVAACWWSSLGGITSLVRQCLSGKHPISRRRTLASPDLSWWPASRGPAPSIGGQRSARPLELDGDPGTGRAGPGRRHLGEQVGDRTPEVLFFLLQAHPFGLHDRRRLIEQNSCRLGVGCHLAHPLCADAAPRPGRSFGRTGS